jgi:peptidyl-prolyl cis-trans isomerase SurA
MRRICLFLGLFLAAVCAPVHGFGEPVDKIVAIVNGDAITESELDLYMSMINFGQEGDVSGADRQELRKVILKRMIEDRLILQEAKSQDLQIHPKRVQERIDEIKRKAGSEKIFEEALLREGFSYSDLRKKLENQLLIFVMVQKEIRSKVRVSPKEITDFFQEHRDEFMTSESVVLESIFVSDEAVFKKVTEELEAGGPFDEVRRRYSERASLGEVQRGQLKKELDDFVFGLKDGQVSKPFAFDNGHYIFLLKEKTGASAKTIEDVKGKIASELEDQKTNQRLREWLETLKDKAYISIKE